MTEQLNDNLLRLDIQHFAEEPTGGEGNPSNPEDNSQGEGGDGVGNQNDEGTGASSQEGDDSNRDDGGEEKTFTQEQVNQLVQDRLAREKKKNEERESSLKNEEERKRLEENEEYKELADKLQSQLDEQKTAVLNSRKEKLLGDAGYTEKQVNFLKSTIEGESDEDIKKSIEDIQDVIAPTKEYTDPGVNNGAKSKPIKRDGTDVGTSSFERIKHKLRR